ncbi:MAG: hypothetical protein PF487_04370 [Bacteroidales bacterium]|jgi:hypothetical protein|nr:hypothetical protein [Bacteroidales bacterium]
MYSVDSRIYTSLLEFENYLIEKNPQYVYIYKITNVDLDDNLVHPCKDLNSVDEKINIIFIMFKMIK